jgi:hypothetical protein
VIPVCNLTATVTAVYHLHAMRECIREVATFPTTMVAYLLCRASVSCTIHTLAECRMVKIRIIRKGLEVGMVVSGRVADLANHSTGSEQ